MTNTSRFTLCGSLLLCIAAGSAQVPGGNAAQIALIIVSALGGVAFLMRGVTVH